MIFFCNSTSVKLPLLNILVMTVAKSTEHFPVFTLLDFSVISDIGHYSAFPSNVCSLSLVSMTCVCVCVCVCVCTRAHMRALIFRHVQPFATPGTAARLLCSWYSLGKNTDPSLVAQRIKRLPAVQEARVQSLRREDPLEKEMATHSSTLAWKIPGTEEPGGL